MDENGQYSVMMFAVSRLWPVYRGHDHRPGPNHRHIMIMERAADRRGTGSG
jgi:hypothetical protein